MKFDKIQEEALWNYADEIGLLSGLTKQFKAERRDFILNESYARKLGELVLQFLEEDYGAEIDDIHQHAQFDLTDMDFLSGDTRTYLEIKRRNCRKDTYPTCDISYTKGDAIASGNSLVLVIYEGGDFFLFSPQDAFYRGEWTHNKYTAEGCINRQITEGKMSFKFEDALMEGKITYSI